MREALIAAARQLLGDRGPEGFSLTDAAKLAGVSPAAPYRHFRDREALLAEVAAEGFGLFGQRLAAALSSAPGQSGFTAMGRAYLAFAREEPGFYAAMFSQRAQPPGEDADGAGRPAYEILLRGVAGALAQHGGAGVDAEAFARQVWALSHGVASLERAGCFGRTRPGEAEDLLVSGVEALLRGARERAAAETAPA
ncbi:TetR/AcrR family transcriptional regulator [Alsobacter sp. KACC 23698]|uniref:TetR/AcrR family transcriptional regulator n=1 Tax=Alsobacter sp. KACC 23698 TaxID=3149229 RepID=A0AAU7JBU5_9HYPH